MSRTISTNELQTLLKTQPDIFLIDIRRKNDYDADTQKILGAQWRNPDEIAQWSDTLPKNKELVVYCARGSSVSNAAVDHLLGQQRQVRYIEGGIEAWKNSGGATTEKTK